MVLCSLRVPFFNCVQALLRQRCAQRSLCPVLHTGLDLLTLETAICANTQVLTPHAFLRTLFIFFKYVVIQRRRLICISLRGRLSENGMIKLGHLLTCLFYIFSSFIYTKTLGHSCTGWGPSCTHELSWDKEASWRLPQAAAWKPGGAEQGFPCPRQKVPSPRAFPSQLVASCSSYFSLGYYCCFPKR